MFLDAFLFYVLLNSHLLKFWELESIHNIYNVPSQPERGDAGAKRRSSRVSFILQPVSVEVGPAVEEWSPCPLKANE